jgi:hypothetical protein
MSRREHLPRPSKHVSGAPVVARAGMNTLSQAIFQGVERRWLQAPRTFNVS